MSVLDSSALLAYLLEEPGAEVVEAALVSEAVIGTVNLAEVLSKLVDAGGHADEVTSLVLGLPIEVAAFTADGARETARLRRATVTAGLSLGDRACLALGTIRGVPVLTADRAWRGLAIGVEVVLIR